MNSLELTSAKTLPANVAKELLLKYKFPKNITNYLENIIKEQFMDVVRTINKHLTERKRLHLLNYPNKGKKRTHSVAFNRRLNVRKSNEPRAKRIQR